MVSCINNNNNSDDNLKYVRNHQGKKSIPRPEDIVYQLHLVKILKRATGLNRSPRIHEKPVSIAN